ncbi:hypothetical protein MMC17_003970 [Xylographa soralifera]|nr:hypothetical protein [Xylographa soralifera]
MQHAQQHGQQYGHDPDDNAVYAHAINHIQNNQSSVQSSGFDPSQIAQAHESVTGPTNSPSGVQHTGQALGGAATVSAIQHMAGPQAGQQGANPMQLISSFMSGGGGPAQKDQLIGMAMAEAKQMFSDQSKHGNVAPGTTEQSAVTSAAETALKMFMQRQCGSSGSGGLGAMAGKLMGGGSGGGGGGAGGLLSMAEGFMR